MSGSRADIHDNSGWVGARPELSVLIPFLGDDPEPLLRRLDTVSWISPPTGPLSVRAPCPE